MVNDNLFKHYLQDKLGHLTHAERSVMEPVLVKYRHVFHEERSNDFQGTDLVEHKIVTGDGKLTRKPQYRVPFAIRKEMEDQVQNMLSKGAIEESTLPWSAPVILVPKKSQDGKTKVSILC